MTVCDYLRSILAIIHEKIAEYPVEVAVLSRHPLLFDNCPKIYTHNVCMLVVLAYIFMKEMLPTGMPIYVVRTHPPTETD